MFSASSCAHYGVPESSSPSPRARAMFVFNLDKTLPKLVSVVEMETMEGPATDRDVMTGFKLYHAIVYCSVIDIKLYRFVNQLLSTERKRTIIQSYANLFHSGVLKGTTGIILAKAFYMDLAATLDLEYGNTLLATSTKSQLQAVRDIDGPFFTNNTDLVKNCVLDSKCDRLQGIIKEMGKMLSSFF